MLAQILVMALCLSVISRCSIETVERIELHLTCTMLYCKKIWVPLKIRLFPFGTLPQTLDLENFATIGRLLKCVINLARQR